VKKEFNYPLTVWGGEVYDLYTCLVRFHIMATNIFAGNDPTCFLASAFSPTQLLIPRKFSKPQNTLGEYLRKSIVTGIFPHGKIYDPNTKEFSWDYGSGYDLAKHDFLYSGLIDDYVAVQRYELEVL